MIEAKGLGKRYGSFVALQNASFELHRGEILGLLGPNGAGKSTTMRILTCFIAPSTGTATVAGCDIWEDPIGVRRAIGYLPESTPLYNEMLVLEYLEWVAAMRGLKGDTARRRILDVVEEVGLEDVIAKAIRELSKGYKQRVGLAQALIHEPPILILDEPMSGLDPNQAIEIRELIKRIGQDRTVILSTHNLAEVQVTCQRVLIIDKGRIVADDTPDALARGVGGQRYHVTVLAGQALKDGKIEKNGTTAASAREVFAKLRHVEAVHELGSHDGEIRLEIVATTEDDLRAEIFRAAVEGGLVLVGLAAKAQNLEQVFRDLTTGAARANEDEDEDEEDDSEGEVEDDETEDDEGADEDESAANDESEKSEKGA
ncbi:MAG TPA: ATP-binding cassette domain-containing protein [Sandaracinaceae bacterium]